MAQAKGGFANDAAREYYENPNNHLPPTPTQAEVDDFVENVNAGWSEDMKKRQRADRERFEREESERRKALEARRPEGGYETRDMADDRRRNK